MPAPYVTKLDINPDEWVQYTVDHFDTARQEWEKPLEHYNKEESLIASLNNKLGRNEHNSFELNYGLVEQDNLNLIELLGPENIDKLGIEHEGILVRLIVNMPGHGVAWHHDAANSYFKKFPGFATSLDEITRLWFSVVPWCNGHWFQIGSSMYTIGVQAMFGISRGGSPTVVLTLDIMSNTQLV